MINVSGASLSIQSPLAVNIDEGTQNLFGFNNAGTNSNRGWTMDNVMRPMISFRIDPNGTTAADIAEIIEYELGNNNANQSTIVYEWYEGNLNFSGASIPAWSSLDEKIQYRIYQDVYSSNQGNTFTKNSAVMRHSGIVIGKNADGDEAPVDLYGGSSPNMLTLCMRRVDNATKLDIWFAFTVNKLF